MKCSYSSWVSFLKLYSKRVYGGNAKSISDSSKKYVLGILFPSHCKQSFFIGIPVLEDETIVLGKKVQLSTKWCKMQNSYKTNVVLKLFFFGLPLK